jgi:glucose-6-phosphate 1-epimerase
MNDLAHDGYLQFVCVESGNALDDRVTVATGDEHILQVRYSIAVLE